MCELMCAITHSIGMGYGAPQMRNHPITKQKDWNKYYVPLAIHGDGTPSQAAGKSWSKVLDVWSPLGVVFTYSTELFLTAQSFS